MPPRASNKKGSPAAKRGPKGRKPASASPLGIVSNENKASESEVQVVVVEETKIAEVVQNTAEEEKGVPHEEKSLEAVVQEGHEVLKTEDKVVMEGETSLTAAMVEEEPKAIGGVVEENNSEVVSGDSLILNSSNAMEHKDNAGETSGGEEQNVVVHMDLDKETRKESDEGAKHNITKEETAAAEVEGIKGSSEVEVSKGGKEVDDSKVRSEDDTDANGTACKDEEADKSRREGEEEPVEEEEELVEEEEEPVEEEEEPVDDTETVGDRANDDDANGTACKDDEADESGSDEEDNDEEEDPSLYMEAPLTDRKKEKEFEIFVGGLDKEAVEEDLIKIFGEFGEIRSARIVKHQTSQKSKGFAFISYATVEQAKKVLAELKDGIEVRGKRVGISASQDNDTLYMGNICKTWTKEQVLETLKSFGIEQIEDIYLPKDPKNEGKSRGFALLEFGTHSDAMAAFQRLRKPDAVFGCDRSAKVAFAVSSIHPSEEALAQVKTVFIEGLTDSWDEEKVKELCKQYGEIEKIQLSRNLGKKRKDFGFVTFTSRESAVACVEGISNAQIVDGDVKVKANLAKPQNKGRLAKRGVRGGFKVEEDEKTEETTSSKVKVHVKSKGSGGKGKKKKAKGAKLSKTQAIVPSRSERTSHQKNRRPPKGEKRVMRDMDTGYNDRPSKKSRGNMHGRPPPPKNSSGRSNRPHSGKSRPYYGAASTPYGSTYAQGYPASSSRYQGHLYAAASGSKRPYTDMEPHAGYLEPAANRQNQEAYGYGPRRSAGYDFQGSSGAAFGGAPASVVPPYVSNYASYGGYQGGGTSGRYVYPSSSVYPPQRPYY